jgi:hypothetical protein
MGKENGGENECQPLPLRAQGSGSAGIEDRRNGGALCRSGQSDMTHA